MDERLECSKKNVVALYDLGHRDVLLVVSDQPANPDGTS
jgi:hypothetical protein